MIARYHADIHQKELKAEKEEGQRLKRIAGQMAKMVREFWTNIEKVVQYKQQSRLEEKRKKAMDLHLSFIVDQTEKYSSWLTEGLGAQSVASSTSRPSSPTDGMSRLIHLITTCYLLPPMVKPWLTSVCLPWTKRGEKNESS